MNWELLIELTKREIKQRYKQSVLGYAWVILNPLAQMLAMAFVFSRILPVSNLGVPYPIFLYVGLLPWTLLSGTLVASANSLIGNGKLLTKIYLPRKVFIQSTILAKMVDFFLAALLLVIFMMFFKVQIKPTIVWFFPIFFIQSLFTYGVSILIATFNLFYRDVQYLLNFLIMIWMYLTPIIYPQSLFPSHYHWLFAINPMAVFITSYRRVIFDGLSPDLWSLLVSLVVSLVIFGLANLVFKKLEGRFADAL